MPGAQTDKTAADLQAAWKKFDRKVGAIRAQARKIMVDAEQRKDRGKLDELKKRIKKL